MSVSTPTAALAVATGLAIVMMPAATASAATFSDTPATFTLGDQTFTILTTTFDELQANPDFERLVPFFGEQPENDNSVQELALLVGDGLGLSSAIIGGTDTGPFFVSRENDETDDFDGLEALGFSFFEDGTPSGATNAAPLFIQRFAPVDFAVVDLTAEPPTAVPGPAVLPGIIGMGLAAMRKRYLAQSDEA